MGARSLWPTAVDLVAAVVVVVVVAVVVVVVVVVASVARVPPCAESKGP